MSRMMVIGIRHDKLDEAEGLKMDDIRLTETDYARPVLEKAGLIVSGHHHSHDSDNIVLNKDGVRYLNSADHEAFREQTKEAAAGPVGGASGLDVVMNQIFKGKDFEHKDEPRPNIESPKITLFAFNTDNTRDLRKDVFKDMVAFIKANPEPDTLMEGNYMVESGFQIGPKSPIKALGTLNENTMAMINLDRGMYGVIALPSKDVDLTSNMLERELGEALGVSEKPKRKLKHS